jgi:S-DNA-T family DNA segregation ATPase FtsK/SpoIIIE
MRTRVKEINFGPTVTQYAIEITMGTKLSKITALANDLALALAAPTGQVRIEAPIPGRSLVGIEIPNISPQIVSLRQLMKSGDLSKKGGDPLLVPLGFDVAGVPFVASISKMPHVLVAGTTGSGKSVMLNAWITTLMMRTRPDELRMILVDPKQVEMVQYNGSPHLLTEVINEPAKVVSALRWSVAEMEARYKELASVGARNLEAFNKLENVTPKPYIVFVIDELADLMMYAANDVEDMITRIAQKARAVGIHLVLATQRPSVDVITGLMKANIPSRIAFNVSSMVDSRVIIDTPGAEKLLGKGDMFYLPPDQAKPRRIQGPYLTDQEVGDVVKFLKSQVPEVHYTEEITDQSQSSKLSVGAMLPGGSQQKDEFFDAALQLISQTDKASASLLQRKLKVGYARAARILDELQEAGYVSSAQGAKPRDVIKDAFKQEV